MKVAQLIQALNLMPQDAEVLTHANSHTTGLGSNSTIAVTHATYGSRQQASVVVIGNWSRYSVMSVSWRCSELIPSGPVLYVPGLGAGAGQLLRGAPDDL